MAYKVLNKTNENYNPVNYNEDVNNAVEMLKQGEYAILPTWEDVESIFEIFDDNEDFQVEEYRFELACKVSKMFAILPTNTTTFQRNQFNKLING